MINNLNRLICFAKKNDVLILMIIPFLTLSLIPLGYEPSGESFNEWAITKLFLDWEGFPKPSLSLGYTLYTSILMSFMTYNEFVLVEYFISFTFLYVCLFLLLRHWLSPIFALLITITFILILSKVEGHNMVISVGFISLYCRQLLKSNFSHLLPLNLLLACCFNQTFILTLLGHYIGVVINMTANRDKKKWKEFILVKQVNYTYISKIFILAIILITYSLSILIPSQRKDNNHFMDEMPWAPMTITSSMDAAIMQINPADYLSRRITIEEAKTQDWYFTNKTVFKNASNYINAMFLAPEVFIENLGYNLKYLNLMPNSFFLKWHKKPIIIISLIISIITVFSFFQRLYQNKNYIFISSLAFGILGIICVLLLTRVTNMRYNVALLPFFITFCFSGLNIIEQKFFPTKKHNFIINFYVFFMLIGSFFSNLDNYNKFHFFNWSSIFSSEKGFNHNFKELNNLVRPDEYLLVKESKWVKAFFNVHHLNVKSLDSLPPFKDQKKLNDLIKNITQFWVEDSIKKVHSTVQSTNYFIRYKNYIIPLVEYAKKHEWEIINVSNIITVYRKPAKKNIKN